MFFNAVDIKIRGGQVIKAIKKIKDLLIKNR